MARRVVVFDYGSGNLRSAQRALQRVGADVEVSADRSAAIEADGLVLPGVGAFASCMAGLREVGGPAIVAERLRRNRPLLGICVGMQVLFDEGVEHGVYSRGLGLVAGRVEQLQAPILPHMGWNTVTVQSGSRLFAGLGEDARYYFVHSYAAKDAPGLAHTAEYGEQFVAAVESDVVCATQFHPEKSADAGATLLANWLGML